MENSSDPLKPPMAKTAEDKRPAALRRMKHFAVLLLLSVVLGFTVETVKAAAQACHQARQAALEQANR